MYGEGGFLGKNKIIDPKDFKVESHIILEF